MFVDSQITNIIINTFTEQNEPVLTIHDSYIVKADKAELLKQTMAEATELVCNNRLPAEQEGQLTHKYFITVVMQFAAMHPPLWQRPIIYIWYTPSGPCPLAKPSSDPNLQHYP